MIPSQGAHTPSVRFSGIAIMSPTSSRNARHSRIIAARVMPITTMMPQAMAVAALASQAARGVAPVAAATPGTAPAKTAPRTALGDALATPLETACERV